MKRYRIDVIHAHHYEGVLVALAVRRLMKHPLVFDVHMLPESELPFYGLGLPKAIKSTIGRRIDRLLPRWADHIIAVSEKIQQKLIEEAAVASNDITVVMNGVESEQFVAQVGHVPSADIKRLIFTGNLAPYQGVDLLLHAFREVLKQRCDVRLLLVTDSPLEGYERLMHHLGIDERIDIIRADLVTLPKHLASADVALNPRTGCDGIPQKLLNYMAAGKPIVSFKGSAAVLEHGTSGWLVDNGDVSGFASAVLHLLNDPALARRLGANARGQAVSEYTWDRAAEKTEAVYRRLLRSPN